MNAGLLDEISSVRTKYSAIIPRERLVIPNPIRRILMVVGQPAANSNKLKTLIIRIQIAHINPTRDMRIPMPVITRMGVKENITKESTRSFNFLLKVHFDVPCSRSLYST